MSRSVTHLEVLKRVNTLMAHKDLIKDILKIEVSESNPLTTDKIFKKVTEWTKIEAELSNHSHNYEEAYFAKRNPRWGQAPRKDSRQTHNCQCCNRQLQGGYKKLCDKCYKAPRTRILPYLQNI